MLDTADDSHLKSKFPVADCLSYGAKFLA